MLLKAINNNSKNKNRTTPCRITHLKRISTAVFKRNEELALADRQKRQGANSLTAQSKRP